MFVTVLTIMSWLCLAVAKGLDLGIDQGWEVNFPRGPHEKLVLLWRATPTGRTHFC